MFLAKGCHRPAYKDVTQGINAVFYSSHPALFLENNLSLW